MAGTLTKSFIARSPNRGERHRNIRGSQSSKLAVQQTGTVTFDFTHSTMGSPREFMFIDSASDRKSANEAVRVHVMRESHRARRQLRGLQQGLESTSHGQMTIFPSEIPTDPTGETPRPRNTSRKSESPPTQQPQTEPSAAKTATTPPNEDQDRLSLTDISALSQIFQLPTKINDPQAFQADLAALCGDDPAPLNALRAITAFISSDTTAASESSSTRIIQLESQALEALQNRIAATGEPLHSDQTILTVLLLARLEHARQNTQVGAYHTAALETMLAQRGGREVVATSHPALAVLLAISPDEDRAETKTPE